MVAALLVEDPSLDVLVVGENGLGKRTPLADYRPQGRGGSGLITMNVTARTGKVVGAEIVEKDDQLVAMTQSGKAIRLRVNTIRTVGRIAQGVKLIDLKADDKVVSIARVVTDAEDGDGE